MKLDSVIHSRDIKSVVKWAIGSIAVGLVPEKRERRAFTRLTEMRRQRKEGMSESVKNAIADQVRAVLRNKVDASQLAAILREVDSIRLEDEWTRWRSSWRKDCSVKTEVDGIEHADQALARGRGIVFWGMAFCDTLFPKICLRHAGIPLTQLSTHDHGSINPCTAFGQTVYVPIYCLPENRYLDNRIFIPKNKSHGYIRDIGKVLRANGTIWIAAERNASGKSAQVELHGLRTRLPTGAPVLARRYGATLIPAWTTRLGPFHYKMTLAPPIEIDASLSRAEGIEKAVQQFAELLRQRILAQPGSWCWDTGWLRQAIGDSFLPATQTATDTGAFPTKARVR